MSTELYAADIRVLPPPTEILANAAGDARAAKMRSFLRQDDRRRCLAAGLLLRAALGEDACKAPLPVGEHGKPYLPGGPCFNLSHSGNYVLLAVDNAPVGADIEQHAPLPEEELLKMAGLAFHPAEAQSFAQNPAPKLFYDRWALKESYIKLTGAGLSLDPASFCVKMEDDGDMPGTPPGTACHLWLCRAFPGHSAAVCLRHEKKPEAILFLAFSPDASVREATSIGASLSYARVRGVAAASF